MTLKEIGEQAYKNADEKGFNINQNLIYDSVFDNYHHRNKELSLELQKTLNFMDTSTQLMHVVTELSEAIESIRKGYFPNYVDVQELFDNADDEQFKIMFENTMKDTFPDEIADGIIILAKMCFEMKIDIEQSIKLKMRYNSLREIKHGKEF
jgi:NTP pyrophosphatase (non-canonical NTP hydrolase)